MADLSAIHVVEDRTAQSRCDAGFLTLRRLRLQNEYADGGRSPEYDCDVVSRRGIDAVVAVLYRVDQVRGRRRVKVLLRRAPRAPIYLRRHKTLVQPDPRIYVHLDELVAGIIEPEDGPGEDGLRRRAAVEASEEAGLALDPGRFVLLGGETFASPGTGDEKLFFCAAEAPLHEARPGMGDGSVMEMGADILELELGEALAACRDGTIPDMKSEVGLARLAEHLGYLPALDCFVDELPGGGAALRGDPAQPAPAPAPPGPDA